VKIYVATMEALKKKEKHANIEVGRVLSKRLVG
jgi:hypothetical protein